jgi:ferrochelatase
MGRSSRRARAARAHPRDCIETTESEIAIEARASFLVAGGQEFHYIDCLVDRPEWIGALADLAVRYPQG